MLFLKMCPRKGSVTSSVSHFLNWTGFVCLFNFCYLQSMYVLSVLRPPESWDNYTAPLQAVLWVSAWSNTVLWLMIRTSTPCCYLNVRLTRHFESSIIIKDMIPPVLTKYFMFWASGCCYSWYMVVITGLWPYSRPVDAFLYWFGILM